MHKRGNTLVPLLGEEIVVTDILECKGCKGMERDEMPQMEMFQQSNEKGCKMHRLSGRSEKILEFVPFAQNYEITRKTEIILSSSHPPTDRMECRQSVTLQ